VHSFLDGPRDTTLFHVLHRQLDLASIQRRPVSLAFLDVDDLTGFNRRHGWSAGTGLLGSISNVLTAIGPDVLAGRFGGDQFAAVLYAMSRRHAISRMREALHRITAIEVHGVIPCERPQISIGGATSRPDGTCVDLMRGAHDALVASKSAGGGRVTWTRRF
jgi:diguanylate cyclase (GGDEF)-like protein